MNLHKPIQLTDLLEVNDYLFSHTQDRILVCHDRKFLRLVDSVTGKVVCSLRGGAERFWSVAWNEEDNSVITAGGYGEVRLWDLGNCECVGKLEGHWDGVMHVGWSPTHELALTGGRDNTLRLWDVTRRTCLQTLSGHSNTILRTVLNAESRTAISCSRDKTIRLWDLDTGVCSHIFEGHSDSVYGIIVGPAGRQLISASIDKTVRIWSIENGACVRVLPQQEGVGRIALSADGRYAVVGGVEGGLELWNLSTGLSIAKFEKSAGCIMALAWIANEKVVCGSIDGAIRMLDLRNIVEGKLDNESKERALVGEVISTVALAGQICREIQVSDWGLDAEVEFKTNDGEASARRVWLQLKSGGSFLKIRKKDGAAIFKGFNHRQAKYWMDQPEPVMLLIRNSNGEIYWMDIRKELRRITSHGAKQVSQIVFVGKRFDVTSVRRWRDAAVER